MIASSGISKRAMIATARRHFDFAYAVRIFDSDYYYEEIDERDYGDEERNICVGTIDERYLRSSTRRARLARELSAPGSPTIAK